MKDKIKRFLIDKKELLIFVTVVAVVFATVITIATLALNDQPVNNDNNIITPGDDNNDDPVVNPGDNNTITPEPTVSKFSLPVTGEYEVVRTFYDPSLSDEELVSAIIMTGSYMVESKGMSYSKSDNSVFDVCSIYDGIVISVEEDELNGTTIVIKHSDEIVGIYSSLSDVNLKTNDEVKVGQVIGKASTSLFDVEAGVHVHLEVKMNNKYVNPTTLFGKELTELEVGK